MSQNYSELIRKAMDDVTFLRKLKRDVDPASCMSISVRRGVPHDNPDIEDDAETRPWRTMGFGGMDGTPADMHRFLDTIIADRIRFITVFKRRATEEIRLLQQIIKEADDFKVL